VSDTRETILQAARALCKATASTSALTDAQVRLMDDPGPRSPLPHLVVNLTSNVPEGYDEAITLTGSTTATHRSRGGRRATIALHGFGAGADEWLESIRSKLVLDSARTVMDAQNVEFINPGTVLYLPTTRDTAIEHHWVLEVEASFLQKVDETIPFARAARVNVTINEQDGSAHLHNTINQNL
jgi:hypothetical protein